MSGTQRAWTDDFYRSRSDEGVEAEQARDLVLKTLQTSPKQSPMYAELLLREAYDVSLGIHNHVEQSRRDKVATNPEAKRPLSLVAMFDAEDTTGAVNIASVAYLFASRKIYERFGLSFTEFLSSPAPYCRDLLEVAEKLQQTDSKVVDEVTSGLNRQFK